MFFHSLKLGLTIRMFLQVFFALVLAAIGVSQASALASDATKARDSAISIFSVLDRESKIDSSSGDGMTLEDVSGNIDFRNVSFKYPLRLDVQIFSDFTLRIPSGKAQLVLDPSDIRNICCFLISHLTFAKLWVYTIFPSFSFLLFVCRQWRLSERVAAASRR
jgi:hypothetical protein